MERILERYQRYSYAERALLEADTEVQGNWCDEYGQLKAKIEALQTSQRYSDVCCKSGVSLVQRCFSFFRESFTEMLHALSFCAIFRHLVGEQLEKLTLKELQQLEQQLETALRKIRSRKVN
ncbi:unnamed protein product [Musa textilis]